MRYYHDRCGNLFIDRGMGSFVPMGAVTALPYALITELAEVVPVQPSGAMTIGRRAAPLSIVASKGDIVLHEPTITRDVTCLIWSDEEEKYVESVVSCPSDKTDTSCCGTGRVFTPAPKK